MDITLQKSFMELLELTDTYSKTSYAYRKKIGDLKAPTQLFDMLEELQKLSSQLDGVISKIEFHAKTANSQTIVFLGKIRLSHTKMMGMITERNNVEVPVNTSSILYDEDNLLKDIVIGMDRLETMDDVTISNIRIDEIVDPKDYSVLSIINKATMFNTVLDVMSGLVEREFCKIYETTKTLKIRLLDLREVVNSGECMDALMSQTWTDEAKGFKSRILSVFYKTERMDEIRCSLISLFQILNAMEDNTGIFGKAVNQYYKITTESFFNPDSDYVIL